MPNEVVKRLRDRRVNVWYQTEALADTAACENRYFTAEEQGTWAVLNEEMDSIDRQIKDALDAEQREWQNAKTRDPLSAAGHLGEVSQRLADRRGNVWDQCLHLADTAAIENRAFTAEEQGTWAVLFEELAALDETIAGALEARQRCAMADEAFARLHNEGKRPHAQ